MKHISVIKKTVMKLLGKDFSVVQLISLALYYGVARHLPNSDNLLMGGGK